MPSFSLTSADGRGYLVRLGNHPVSIGRSAENTLPLASDELASRRHAVIEPDGTGGYVIRDLGSRNGTKVNKERLTAPRALAAGDLVKIGGHTFTIEAEQSLGEVRSAVRGSTLDSDQQWLDQLRGMVDGLPPKNQAHDEGVGLIDSRGEPSAALGQDTPGPNAMRLLLLLAMKARATDLHVEPKPHNVSVRMRVDGQMTPIIDLPESVGILLIGVAKAACHMHAAGKDAVQDGHFSARFRARRVDYRVSLTPSMHGQKLVIRVLDRSNAPRSLTELGLPDYMLAKIKKVCEKENGMFLSCGPTGSGKTTTLYNSILEIDRETSNVITIEDPVEYALEGVTQIPVDEAKGNTFSGLLRSVLRQDPDVILVGEIRDEETARTALQAAITGHVVFSTVHAKDSITAVFRLLDLKVEPYLIANALDLIVAQRLLRVLCENCKRAVRISPGQSARMGRYFEGKSEAFEPVGCAQCLKTGYRGRRAIYEMLEFTQDLRDVILRDPSIGAIRKITERGIFNTLLQNGWTVAAKGQTSLDEVERVAGMN
jgi:general secretion pathway protein E